MTPVIILALIIAIGWALLVLPARRRQREHELMQDDITVGDEIITAGGIHAFVREDNGDDLRVEIAKGILVTLDRRAVAAVATEDPVEVSADDTGDVPEQG